jgi:hypothetical protein
VITEVEAGLILNTVLRAYPDRRPSALHVLDVDRRDGELRCVSVGVRLRPDHEHVSIAIVVDLQPEPE